MIIPFFSFSRYQSLVSMIAFSPKSSGKQQTRGHFLVFTLLLLASLHAVRAEEPVVRVVQQAAPDATTRSITFLSSGYTTSLQSVFNSDVNTVVAALSNYSTGIISDPWPRYAAQFNIYSVFEASSRRGLGVTTDTNLFCRQESAYFPRIYCSVPKIATLATYAPAVDIILVLQYSTTDRLGAGGNGIAVVTTTSTYLPVLAVHYLNRAIANLQDEFNTDAKGTSSATIPNCASDMSRAVSRWGYWLGTSTDGSAYGSGCTFGTYYAPTENQCLMRSASLNTMCPICREELNLAFFNEGVTSGYTTLASTAPLSLSAGQCPPAYETVVAGTNTVLYAGSFAASMNDVTVEWRESGATTVLATGSTFTFASTTFTLPTTIEAVITDSSQYVRPTKRSPLVSTVSFKIVASSSSASAPSCYTSLGLTSDSTSYCEDGDSCAGGTQKELSQQWTTNKTKSFTPPSYGNVRFILPVVLVGTLSVALFVGLSLYYVFRVRLAPREVLNTGFSDHLLVLLLVICIAILWCTAVAALSCASRRLGKEISVVLPVISVAVVLGSLTIAFCIVSFISVLMRWTIICALCATAGVCVSITSLIFGGFSLFGSAGGSSRQFQNVIFDRWDHGVKKRHAFVCDFQWEHQCSGFFTSCFQLGSSSCIPECASNFFMNSCGEDFTEFIKSQYSPIDGLLVAMSCLLVLCAALLYIFSMRYRSLSATGKFSRLFHNNPQPPVLPITSTEVKNARRSFKYATRGTKDGKMSVEDACDYLECVFSTLLKADDKTQLKSRDSTFITFDELMLFYFPHMQTSHSDPRMVTADEASAARSMLQLERKQWKKLESFEEAAGCLSPEDLHKTFQQHYSDVFMPDTEDILKSIRAAAAKCPDAPMCRGLSRSELEGLRGLWVSLHPEIGGCLSEKEVEKFYEYSHGEKCSIQESRQWKQKLDVRKTGKIGWAEFCYPYAQRALLQDARDYLRIVETEVPPEIVSKSFVLEVFGSSFQCAFLPYETEIPIERVIVAVLRRHSDNPLFEKRLFDKDIYHLQEVHATEVVSNKKQN